VSYRTPGALRMALERRLMDHSRQSGLPLSRLRKAVAFERMLARLVRANGDRWVLKGAIALELRGTRQTRTTKDLDLAYALAEDDALATLREAARQDLEDGFVFSVEKASEYPRTIRARSDSRSVALRAPAGCPSGRVPRAPDLSR
jgi:Tfp pilus assembly protein FimV